VEETPLIPSGVQYTYFPLGGDIRANDSVIEGTVNSNHRFFDNSVFVGNGTKNEVSTINFGWSPNAAGYTAELSTYKDISPYGSNGVYVSKPHTTGGRFYTTNTITLPSAGASFTISAIVKWTTALHTNTFYVREYDGAQVREKGWMAEATKIPLGDGWYWCYANVTPLANTKTVVINGYLYAATAVWLQCLQVEFKDYASPFAGYGKTIAANHVVIPSTIIPDYTGDWTVFGWYKLFEGNTGSGYEPLFCISDSSTDRILVMHENSSISTRPLKCWYGNDTSGWSFYVSSRVRQLNKWMFFALRHTKADNQMKLYGFDGETFDSGYRIGAASDLNPTFTNNINIGYWSSHRATGQFRDYGFVLKALTDAEIERLAKGMMSQTKEKVYISNMIREKVL
jgi:hypothetical protein